MFIKLLMGLVELEKIIFSVYANIFNRTKCVLTLMLSMIVMTFILPDLGIHSKYYNNWDV